MRSRADLHVIHKPSERVAARADARAKREAAAATAEHELLRDAAKATRALAAAAQTFETAAPGTAARAGAENAAAQLAESLVAILAARSPATFEGMRTLARLGKEELPMPLSFMEASDAPGDAIDRARGAFRKSVNGYVRHETAAALASARAGATVTQAMILDLPGFAVRFDTTTTPPSWLSNATVPAFARDVDGQPIDVRGATLPGHLDKLVGLVRDHCFTFTIENKTYAWGNSHGAGIVERVAR